MGLIYGFAKDLGKYLKWNEDSKLVDNDWLSKSGFKEKATESGYLLRWSLPKKLRLGGLMVTRSSMRWTNLDVLEVGLCFMTVPFLLESVVSSRAKLSFSIPPPRRLRRRRSLSPDSITSITIVFTY